MMIIWMGYLYVISILAIATIVAGKITLGLIMLVFGAILPAGLALWTFRRKQLAQRAKFLEAAAALAEESGKDNAQDQPDLY